MAVTGTGLPTPQDAPVLAQAPAPLAHMDAFSSADAWNKIADAGAKIQQAGEKVTDTSLNLLEKEVHLFHAGAVADGEVEHATNLTKIAGKYNGNPGGYENEARAYIDGALSGMSPTMVPHFKEFMNAKFQGGLAHQITVKNSQEVRSASDTLDARIAMADRDVMGHAMAGTLGTDVGKAAASILANVVNTAVSDGVMNPDKATLLLRDAAARADAEVLVKDIGDKYRASRANGETAGPIALKAAEDRILRGNLPLTEDQRFNYFHKATAEVRALEAERKNDLAGARAAASDVIYSMAHNVRPDPVRIDEVANQLNAAGGQADVAKLRAAAARAEQLAPFNQSPLSGMIQQLSAFNAGTGANASPEVRSAIADAAAKTGVPANYLYQVASTESGFNPNARSQTSTAGGLFQFTDKTWADTLSTYGSKHGLDANASKTDPRANALMAAEFTKSNMTALQAAGIPINDGTLYAAHFAGAAGAVKLFNADPNTSAADLLPAAAAANKGFFYNSQGTARTVGEVVTHLTVGGGVDGRVTPAPGSDLRLFSAQQAALDKRTQEAWDTVSKDLDAGTRPNPAALDQLITGATLAGNHNLLETMAARLERFDAVASQGRKPLGSQQSVIGDLNSAAAAGALAPGVAAYKKDIEARYSAIVTGLEKNPITTTVTNFSDRFQQPAPLDVANSDNFRAGLNYRAKISAFAAQNWETRQGGVLDQADLTKLHAALDAATPIDKARIFSDLTATLPEPARNATLAALGSKGPSAMVQAFAGALYGRDPDLGASIFRGQAAEKAEPRYNPATGSKKDDFNKVFDERLPASAFAPDLRVNDSGAMATMRGAAIARYADLSAQAGDTSGDLSEPRLTRAIDDVTGGVVRHNGGSLIAPASGMPQSRFDAVMAGIKDDDLAGVSTLHGAPVTADYLRRSARLESVGDGRYLVAIGNNPTSPLYAVEGANTEMPRPFVLDLRGREAATLAMPTGDTLLMSLHGVVLP